MKRFTIVALALALGLGFANAQTITKSLQGSQDPRGPVGLDSSNNAYFPNHVNPNGNTPPTIGSGSVTAGSTDNAGSFLANSTSAFITFGTAFGATPKCVFTALASSAVPSAAVTATGISLTLIVSSTTYDWLCFGNQ